MMDTIAKDIILKVVIVVVIALLAYFLIARPVLQKLGILQTKQDKQRDKLKESLGSSLESPFSPAYYKSKGAGAVLLPRSKAQELARTINSAIGTVWDDENAVYGALRQLKAKTQLSFLAEVFFQEYKIDLYSLLQRNLSDKEIDIVNNIAANLS